MTYADFLASKAIVAAPTGIENPSFLTPHLKPFQAAITRWALRRGKAAIFAGTGLGKTLMQLSWARAVGADAMGRTLILCPLAVAEQTVAEASKFGIGGVRYALDQKSATGDIVVTNYERFEKFKIEDFAAIVLDESGIIKSQDGKTRAILTEACRATPWRLCCSATPAPNDYTELGQHAEFLGVMSAKEMLATFFVHDGSIRADDHSQGNDGWRLKRHATGDFWRWLASWSVMVRHPSDLGFDEPGYDLPPLNLHEVTVAAEYLPSPDAGLFPMAASTLGERITARKETAGDRVRRAVEVVSAEPGESWLVWCNLNSEADAIEAALPTALQVAGRHSQEIKVERLLGFKESRPAILVSKPSIAGHGMNYQHCARVCFVGLTDSFEALYQAIRRTWRFGQMRPVEAYFIVSEREGNVVANLRRKELAFNEMLDAMSIHMRDLMRENVIGRRTGSTAGGVPMEVPAWLM